MSDTKIERSICQAIEIIADKKISQANFDKSIKAVILQCIDRTTGNYRVKYQDSTFQANATSSQISYNKGQQVWVLIPGNDWDRTKTILCGVESSATMYKEIPMAGDLYNTIGGNLAEVENSLGLSSYYNQTIPVYNAQGKDNKINIDQKAAERYITQGNGLALGMVVQTKLAPGQQIAGDYGVRFVLKFKDSKGDAAVRDYVVNSTDVIGYPYGLIEPTLVERFIESVDTENFECIQRVQIYCNDFPHLPDPTDQSKRNIKDILITDIKINGATALTEQELSGYSLHIDCSQDGDILSEDKSIITLEAQLKSSGKIIKDKVEYYWFRQNGLIFRGSDRYSGFAGDGWECLNYYSNNTPVAFTENTFTFTSIKNPERKEYEVINLVEEKDTKIKCVAVYDKRERVIGESHVYNQNFNNEIYIESSDLIEGNNKVDYYLDAGRPILTCKAKDKDGIQLTNVNYSWSVTPARGSAVQKPNTDDQNNKYENAKKTWDEAKAYVQSLAAADQQLYIETTAYKTVKENWQKKEYIQRIDNNKYYYFPISSITDYSKISCAIEQEDGTYLGTASIVLYNHPQTEGTYNLNIENGTQVFQYDGKGNSPASKQLQKPLEILPLSFTLLDNTGTQISYDQIINNGTVRWLIPGTSTLLFANQEEGPDVEYGSTLVTGTDLAFAADYNIYKNRPIFHYIIDDTYDSKKTNNHIRLNIVYKDITLDAYTDFTFPKDGDPGTNGTDYVAKISPSKDTDRIYITNKSTSFPFNDQGNIVDKLNFSLYNNSKKIDGIADNSIVWTCPPGNKAGNTYLKTPSNGKIQAKVNSASTIAQALTNIKADKPIDIIRANYTNGQIQQYAQYPICYEYLISANYRIKVKPKTGFKYAVYQEDGTAPEYDNTLPFEIIVEEREENTGYFQTGLANLTYNWQQIGNIQEDTDRNIGLNSNQKYYKPKNTFDGSDLTSAVVVKVTQNNTDIGFIHIPVYMIINRYNHQALNGWDGNSIQLNTNGDTILAPQIGAGKKQSDNTFTGVFMGDVKGASGTEDIGLMGYHHGQRSIFLDAQTGKAQFGKQGSGQIKIDPNLVVRTSTEISWDDANEAGLLYSNNYTLPTETKITTGINKDKKGYTLDVETYKPGNGLIIDLSTPQIGFGSGRFYVTKTGNIHAGGDGDIAGWRINDDAFYKHDGTNKTGMRSNGDPAFYAGTDSQNSIDPTSTNVYNFFVTHNGYLFSRSGKIAKWSINENTLTDGNVGMGQGKSIAANTFDNQTSVITNARIWSGSNNTTITFAVTADGKLYSKDGRIASWSISKDQLIHTSGKMGMGSYGGAYKIKSGTNTTYNTTNNAIFWSNNNFAVDEGGNLYSASGKIGGWNITENNLWAGNLDGKASGIRISSTGSIDGGTANSNSRWSIKNDGTVYFNSGTIGGWHITDNNLWTKSNQNNGSGLRINSNGSLNGSNWSIEADGDAYFRYIHGIIASTSGGTAYLTNGTSGNGSDGTFSIGSDGSCRFGIAGVGNNNKALTYTPNGVLTLGNWTIAGDSIKNEAGATELQQTSIITKDFYHISSGGTAEPGLSGTITFSDGSSLRIGGGLILAVNGADGVTYDD